MAAPYATVIDINRDALPAPKIVDSWDSATYAESLRHDQKNPNYNIHFRQLLHVGYKVAAEIGPRYLGMLQRYEEVVSKQVTENIFERHFRKIFIDN